MEVLAVRPVEASQPGIAGKIISRTFLGETWDYIFDSDSALRLRVVSPPAVTLEINQPVWLRIDSAQIVRVEEAPAAA